MTHQVQHSFTPSAALTDLINDVQYMSKQYIKTDVGAFIANFPLFLMTYGLVTLPIEDASLLKTTAMPDAWLCKVSQYMDASPTALKQLAKAVDLDGFASIESADRYCAMELTREQKIFDAASKLPPQSSTGIQLLKTRVDSFGIEVTLTEVLDRGTEYTKQLAQAGLGVAALAVETTVWVGKGLGAVAGALKKLR